MSRISISISTEHGSTFGISGRTPGLVSILSRVEILSGYMNQDQTPATHTYSNDVLNIHGTLEDLQLFADRLVAAVYPEKCQPDVDAQVDSEREASAASIPGAGDVEIPAAAYIDGRNAAVADPLRGIINAISPAVTRG